MLLSKLSDRSVWLFAEKLAKTTAIRRKKYLFIVYDDGFAKLKNNLY
jgi:hypothetical protein